LNDLLYLVYYISVASGFIPLSLYIENKRLELVKNNKKYRYLFYFVSFRLLTELGILILSFAIKNSFPIVHFSVLITYGIVLKIFDSIYSNRFLKIYYLLGFLVFLFDLFLTSNLFEPCLFSSFITFLVIILLSIRILNLENISKEDDKLVSAVFVLYLVLLGYYLFLSFLIQRSQVSNMATYIMLIFNMFFNIAIAKIIWSKRMS
jgi:hypothetical protein